MGYHHIINLLVKSFDQKTDDFVRYTPDIKDTMDKNDSIINTLYKSIVSYFKPDVNKRINDYVDRATSHVFKNPDKKQIFWNHRQIPGNDKCSWAYQMTEYYDKYVKDELTHISDTFDLDYSEDDNHKQLKYNMIVDMKYVSMVNMLIFGKTNITFNFLERLLSYIRYTENNYVYQLDNYQITKYVYGCGYNKKIYQIEWRHDNIHTLKFCQTDYEKLYAAKNLINLMNETDPSVLNYHNYVIVGNWIMANDMSIQSSYSAQFRETSRLESESKLYSMHQNS
jgi:hypothetical protein